MTHATRLMFLSTPLPDTAYDAIFSAFSDDDRAWLFRRTAERWYAGATADDA